MAGFRTLMTTTALAALPVALTVAPDATAVLDVYFAVLYAVAALAGLSWIGRELLRDWLFWRQAARPPDTAPARSATRDHGRAA